MFLVYVVLCLMVLVVITSAIDCLERFVSKMTYYVSSGMLNPTHSLTHYITFLNSENFYLLVICASTNIPFVLIIRLVTQSSDNYHSN